MRSRLFLRLILACGVLLPWLVHAGVDTAWVRRYDGPAHLGDNATCVAVDSKGNVVVTGVSAGADSTPDWVTIKYSSAGDSLWADRRSFAGNGKPLGLGVDTAGNVYVTGYQNTQAVTIKYSPTGQLLWESRLPSESYAKDLALDAAGNVLICGSALNSSYDFMAVKYRSNGDTAWVRYYDWLGDLDDARALAVGVDGSVAVTGPGYGNGTGDDYLTVKYDSSGNRQWAATYHGPAGPDTPADIATDSQGDVFVTGSSEGAASSWDYLTVMYSPAGETLWSRRYNGTSDGDDEVKGEAVGSDGTCYVTGYAQYTDTGYDFATIAYRPDGSVAWLARYDGPTHSGDGAYAVAVDDSRRVYLTGSSYAPQTKADCVTVCYDSLGDTTWVSRYNSPSNWAEYMTALALGPNGAVCVAGIGYTADGFSCDMLTIKYVPDGGMAEENYVPVALRPSLFVEPSVFNTRTTVRFSVGSAASRQVLVFDALGNVVRELPIARPGQLAWDATDGNGHRLAAGLYFVRLAGGATQPTRKLVLLD